MLRFQNKEKHSHQYYFLKYDFKREVVSLECKKYIFIAYMILMDFTPKLYTKLYAQKLKNIKVVQKMW